MLFAPPLVFDETMKKCGKKPAQASWEYIGDICCRKDCNRLIILFNNHHLNLPKSKSTLHGDI